MGVEEDLENEAASTMEIRTFSGSLSRISFGGRLDDPISRLLSGLGCLGFFTEASKSSIHVVTDVLEIENL